MSPLLDQLIQFLREINNHSQLIGSSQNLNLDKIIEEMYAEGNGKIASQSTNNRYYLYFVDTLRICQLTKYEIELTPDLYLVSLKLVGIHKYS